MSGWRILAAGPEDADALVALEKDAFGAGSWGEAGVRGGFTAPFVSVLFACSENDAAPKGFALWRRLGDEGEILSLGVAPEARRRGAGGALVSAVLAAAEAGGLGAMFLEVDAGNAAARALYAGFGFTKVGERRGYYRDGADALVLRKQLC